MACAAAPAPHDATIRSHPPRNRAVAAAFALLAAVASLATMAPSAAAPAQGGCPGTAAGAGDLRYVTVEKSLADLSLAIATDRQADVTLQDVTLLEGRCAAGVQAFQMSLLLFNDGAVFGAWSPDRVERMPALTAASLRINPATGAHPAMAGSEFIMASTVHAVQGDQGQRTLDVGLWRSGNAYIVAAYLGRDGRFGTPVELVRSTQPIRGVTYFPAPDANAGKVGLVVSGNRGTLLIGLGWHHAALSKELFGE